MDGLTKIKKYRIISSTNSLDEFINEVNKHLRNDAEILGGVQVLNDGGYLKYFQAMRIWVDATPEENEEDKRKRIREHR